MWRSVLVRILAFLLIAEAVWSAFWIAGLIPTLAIYPAPVAVLVAIRAGVAALEGSAGWRLATRRPDGLVLARWGVLGSAVLTTAEIGWRMAPSDFWPWYRWYYVGAYWVYAVTVAWYAPRPAHD